MNATLRALDSPVRLRILEVVAEGSLPEQISASVVKVQLAPHFRDLETREVHYHLTRLQDVDLLPRPFRHQESERSAGGTAVGRGICVFRGMGLAIVELRESRDMSKADLASKARIVLLTLRRIELGETDARWGTLRRLAPALKIPLDAMMEMAEEFAPGVGREARRQNLDYSA